MTSALAYAPDYAILRNEQEGQRMMREEGIFSADVEIPSSIKVSVKYY